MDLSRDGKRVAIGAIFNDGGVFRNGHVRVYDWTGSAWEQAGEDIDGEASADYSGMSVSLSGDGLRVAIGAPGNDGATGYGYCDGHVRVYEMNGSSEWVKLGNDIDGIAELDKFGSTVSLSFDGRRLAAGADGNDSNGQNSGHVRVFEYIGNTWTQMGSDIRGDAPNDRFGSSVSIADNGEIVGIGAPNNGSGYVRVLGWDGAEWRQIGPDITGENIGDKFGASVSLAVDGRRIAIGGSLNDGDNGYYNGHVRVLEFDNGDWVQLGTDIDGEADDDISGSAVALISDDGKRIAIGAPFNDGNGSDSGHVRVYELFEGSGTGTGGGGE